MKKRILEVLDSMANLEILEVEKDYIWHDFEGSLGDVKCSIHVCPKTSRSVKSARHIQRQIEAAMEGMREEGTVYLRGPNVAAKKKDGVLTLGLTIYGSVIGTEDTEHRYHVNDPDVANIETEGCPFKIADGYTYYRTERKLTRAILIIVYPDPAIYKAGTPNIGSARDLKELEIPHERLTKILGKKKKISNNSA